MKLTIKYFLEDSFKKFADNPFLGFVDEKWLTYDEVRQKVIGLRAWLERNDIKPGDKVAILSNNMPNWCITYFAVTGMGAVAVPILPDFSTFEIKQIIEHSESKMLFVSELLRSKIQDIKTEHLILSVCINDFTILEGQANGEVDFNESPKNDYQIEEDDTALIIYTSGTIGKPKGVMLSHCNLIFDAQKSGMIQPIHPNDKFLSILPLSHSYENTIGLLLPMINGASIYYLKKLPTPVVLIPAMQEVKPTIILSVPLVIEKIYKNKILPAFNEKRITRILYKIPLTRKLLNGVAGRKLMQTFGGNLKFFGIGGAKLDPVVEKFLIEAKFPYAIGYGLTEAAPLVAGVNPQTVRLESTGPKIDGIELKLNDINPKTGEGEIWVRGPMVMKGYYKEPELTKEVITPDGWLKTGDLATMDDDGYVYIKGRSKNVIIGSSGENIYPEEIESIINNFDFVIESLVIEEKGRLVALVHLNIEELEEKYQHLKGEIEAKLEEWKDSLRKYINDRVNKFSAIHSVKIHKAPFEKTPTQKIKRFKYK